MPRLSRSDTLSSFSREAAHEPSTPYPNHVDSQPLPDPSGRSSEHHHLSKLTNSLASTADKDSLDALLIRLAKVDERLDTVDGKHLVSNDDVRSSQQALSNRIDAVQTCAKQATGSAEELSRNVMAAEEQVLQLKASLELLPSV